VPFAYYARLTRAQQAIYRKSDGITEVRLPRPAELHPLVATLESALRTEDRATTQEATERLVRGLADALGLPPVRVEVLAARPHAKWGELHGLYTAERGKTPKIQLWMRTAKQKRVVAFRTYLRTLLHEVGHHLDYAGLRLADSFHTEGFYKRESSLFAQLVPERPAAGVPATPDAYLARPREQHLARLARTPDDLARAVAGRTALALARPPAPAAWSGVEVVGHLLDAEEYFALRLALMQAMTEPVFPTFDGERLVAERQHRRHDAEAVVDAFRGRRRETLAHFTGLRPADWRRAGVSRARGRMTVGDHAAVMAWHDDNHLDQLTRALEGQP
jgi:hypothetical protein